jgi:hypothetical protein
MNVSSDFRIGLYAIHDIAPHTEVRSLPPENRASGF